MSSCLSGICDSETPKIPADMHARSDLFPLAQSGERCSAVIAWDAGYRDIPGKDRAGMSNLPLPLMRRDRL